MATHFYLKVFYFFLACVMLFVSSLNAQEDTHENLKNRQEILNDFFSELDEFNRIFLSIKRTYVDEISDEELFKKAIKGMINELDPHSAYLEPKERTDILENSSGKFGGLGIVINMKDGLVEVISPIDDTPAYRAGIQAGDLIIKIDNISVRGLDLSEAVAMMRGVPNTSVRITVLRENQDPFEVNVIRDIITVTSVSGYLLEENIGYIRISHFQAPSEELIKKTLLRLVSQNNDKALAGVVLDLRNNPGGLLSSAVQISDLFLDDSGVIVSTKGRRASAKSKFYAKPGDILKNIPIIALINRGTASAAEILVAALQDYKRAIVIGEKSFGKGSVQTIISLPNGYGLKITTARYYSPNDRVIQAKGIVPDIVLDKFELKVKDKKNNLATFEKDLKGHLTDLATNTISDINGTLEISIMPVLGTQTILDKQAQQKKERDEKTVERLKMNYFVHEAINILKAMHISSK